MLMLNLKLYISYSYSLFTIIANTIKIIPQRERAVTNATHYTCIGHIFSTHIFIQDSVLMHKCNDGIGREI